MDIWIFYDADDPGDPSRPNNDYPDTGDNHGKDGANVTFCDGHASWISQKQFLRRWYRGTDENHSGNSMILISCQRNLLQ